jgi:Lon-like ATP-dependent protease
MKDKNITMTSTEDFSLSERLMDQIIGQEQAVDVVKLAARQKRFLLIVGEPGTGKSMLGRAVAELMSLGDLQDVLAFPNDEDPFRPRVKCVPAGEGEKILERFRREGRKRQRFNQYLFHLAIAATFLLTLVQVFRTENYAYLLGGIFLGLLLVFFKNVFLKKSRQILPRVLISRKDSKKQPFVDATGLQQGGLLGDVRHDPYQSGGVETPPHQLLEAGAIHRAHGGVLFIDEMATLSLESQQNLLTAIQEKELAITGRSAASSGSMVASNPLPCDFLLILAGNEEDLEKLHPALRSRIRGFGYEICTRHLMTDNAANCRKFFQFVAQEVRRDGKIPHFSKSAVEALIEEARLRSGKKGFLCARFRELGGLLRVAGDLAVQEGQTLVQANHVQKAVPLAKSLEEQGREIKGEDLEQLMKMSPSSRYA